MNIEKIKNLKGKELGKYLDKKYDLG